MLPIGCMSLDLTFGAHQGDGKAAVRTDNNPPVTVNMTWVVQTPPEAHLNGLQLRRIIGRLQLSFIGDGFWGD